MRNISRLYNVIAIYAWEMEAFRTNKYCKKKI